MIEQVLVMKNTVSDSSPAVMPASLSEIELHQLIVEWNDTDRIVSDARSVHELFESQAEMNPNAVAAVMEREEITYSQLNRKANQLAHRLIKMGAVPEDIVGICMDRS